MKNFLSFFFFLFISLSLPKAFSSNCIQWLQYTDINSHPHLVKILTEKRNLNENEVFYLRTEKIQSIKEIWKAVLPNDKIIIYKKVYLTFDLVRVYTTRKNLIKFLKAVDQMFPYQAHLIVAGLSSSFKPSHVYEAPINIEQARAAKEKILASAHLMTGIKAIGISAFYNDLSRSTFYIRATVDTPERIYGKPYLIDGVRIIYTVQSEAIKAL
jgi:hypothetical protein